MFTNMTQAKPPTWTVGGTPEWYQSAVLALSRYHGQSKAFTTRKRKEGVQALASVIGWLSVIAAKFFCVEGGVIVGMIYSLDHIRQGWYADCYPRGDGLIKDCFSFVIPSATIADIPINKVSRLLWEAFRDIIKQYETDPEFADPSKGEGLREVGL